MVITAVTSEMVPQVREFLSSRKEFAFQRDWDGVFEYAWKQENFPYGYAIVHEGNILGFLGTLFCERVIGGNTLVCCNLSSWVVDDGHKGARSLAVALLAPALKIKNVLITCYTANERAQKSYERIGFKPLDREQITVPTITSYLGWPATKSRKITGALEVIEKILNKKDGKILKDHRKLNCQHLLVQDLVTNRYCYAIGTNSRFHLRGLPFSSRLQWSRLFSRWSCFNLCYASDPIFFVENIHLICRHLWTKCGALALRYDSRLIPGRLSILERKLPTERLFFSSANFEAVDVDDLYSELVTHNTY